MPNKKYQVRIRKDVTDSITQDMQDAISVLGIGTATEIRTLIGRFESLEDAFKKMATVEELKEFEIISIILIDTVNAEQLGEEFEWEEEE